MLQYQMLTAEQLRVFFVKHDIPLEGEKNLEYGSYLIAADAYDFGGLIFLSFLVYTMLNGDRSKIQTVFNSYEDVAESYNQYLMGYTKAQRTLPLS